MSQTNALIAALQNSGETTHTVHNSQDVDIVVALAMAAAAAGEPVNLIGYSAGAQTAVAAAGILNERGISVSTVTTIDSVPINPRGVDPTRIPPNVELNINIIGIGGPFESGRSGANNGAEGSSTEVRNIPQGGSHSDIPRNEEIIKLIRDSIKRASPPSRRLLARDNRHRDDVDLLPGCDRGCRRGGRES